MINYVPISIVVFSGCLILGYMIGHRDARKDAQGEKEW